MSLKSFLQEKGYIQKDDSKGKSTPKDPDKPKDSVPPTYFPLDESTEKETAVSVTTFNSQNQIEQTDTSAKVKIDTAFIKFFEDELVKANLPGPDYFEFRKQMITMHQKMANKGATPEVILQAVLTSFEAQDVPPAKLAEAAQTYKRILANKKEDFLKGAAAEKSKQIQNRQSSLQSHQNNLTQMQSQLQQLQKQMNQLNEDIKKEQLRIEMDKTSGKEGIEKIERAEKQIVSAYEYMISSIDSDINQLRSS